MYANDLYSAAKERATEVDGYRLTGVLARQHGLPASTSVRLAADFHAARDARPEALRWLDGLTAWITGSLARHRTSARCHVPERPFDAPDL